MKTWLVRMQNGDLRPLEDDTLRGIAIGEAVEFEYKRPRNYKFLQKFFVFLKAVYDIEAIQDQYSSIEHLRYALTMDAGHFEEVIGFDGCVYLTTKSISFKDMDENEFNQFYKKVMAVVLKNLPNYCQEDINEMERRFLTFI